MTTKYVPPYLKEAAEPPAVKEGDRLKAQITEIKKTEGQFGDQLQFTLDINGFQCKDWIKFYEEPSMNSKLGKLCVSVEESTGQRFESLQGCLKALKSLGYVTVECTGMRDYNGVEYPKFSILVTRLPEPEKKQAQAEEFF